MLVSEWVCMLVIYTNVGNLLLYGHPILLDKETKIDHG